MIIREKQSGGWFLYRPAVNVKECRREWNEQVDVVAWIREYYPEWACLMFHPANEGDISPQYRQDQIKAGLLAGVSDLIFLAGRGGIIEMKRCMWSSRATPEQRRFLELAANQGRFAAVANGADAAKVAFLEMQKNLLHWETAEDKVALPEINGDGKNEKV